MNITFQTLKNNNLRQIPKANQSSILNLEALCNCFPRIDKSNREISPGKPLFERIPSWCMEYHEQARFVNWQWAFISGRWTKPPYAPLSPMRHAATNNTKTWALLSSALANVTKMDMGIGLCLLGLECLVILDIDDGIGDDGIISSWAISLIQQCNSYTELSPSGRGFKIYGRLQIGFSSICKKIRRENGQIEIFSNTERYVVLTGATLEPQKELADLSEIVTSLLGEISPRAKKVEASNQTDLLNDKHHSNLKQAEIDQKKINNLLDRCGLLRSFIIEELATKWCSDRSAGFHGIVAKLKRMGFSIAEIIVLFLAFPNSCWVKKYNGRLEGEVKRSWDKIQIDDAAQYKLDEESSHYEESCKSLPIIQINGGGLSDEADQAEAALIEAGVDIYQRGGELVRPYCVEMTSVHNKSTKITQLSKVTEPALNDLLCRSAVFVRQDARSGDVKRINPPPALAKTILARQGSWKFRTISGVVSSPILRPDGSVMMHEGYDPITCLYVDGLPPLPEVPAHPTRENALTSLKRILCLISEFPFVDEASRSVGLSGIITAVCRSAMQTSPMHVATAPTPGTGKSFLHDIAALIATGSRCPVTAFSKSADENEKRLDGSLLDGAPIISIDNANGELGGDKLCQAVERPLVEVRRLGSSDKQKIENRSTIFANGNNITLRGDITRRAIIARLDSALERPEARQFKCRPDQMILADRGRYIVDCLIIVCAYIQAGSPNLLPSLSSFEDWSNIVRSALVWLGCADPLNTMKLVQEGDPEHMERCHVFSALYDVFASRAVSVKEIISAAQEISSAESDDTFGGTSSRPTLRHPELAEALMEIAGRNERIDNDLLGKWLRANKERIADGRQLIAIATSKRTKWAVRTCAPAGSS